MKDQPVNRPAGSAVESQLQQLLHRLQAAFVDLNDEALRLRDNLLAIDSTQRTALLIARAAASSRRQAGSSRAPTPRRDGA